jgi:hypothetical protein
MQHVPGCTEEATVSVCVRTESRAKWWSVTSKSSASAQDVLTYHNNNARTGLDSKETILTTANVNATSFGKLFTIPVDGKVDAQPLYLSAVTIAGKGTHNLLIVATEHGTVYASDAAPTGRKKSHDTDSAGTAPVVTRPFPPEVRTHCFVILRDECRGYSAPQST